VLKELEFSVTFPSTGQTRSGRYDLTTGLTTITGPNGAGKSLLLEMIRFALHGSKALRTTTSKYKALSVRLGFTLRGSDYGVARTLTKAVLERGLDTIAVGTTPVNVKVAELFGYGLEVFDASHAVNQGQIEALGAMKPSERKAMVDRVIGLNVIDDLLKYVSDTAAGHRRDADTIKEMLVVPIEPVQPEDYRPYSLVKAEVDRLQLLKSERDNILGQLQHKFEEPQWPAPPIVTETVLELEALQKARELSVRELARLQGEIAGIPDPEFTAYQLDWLEDQVIAHKAWAAYKHALDAMPPHPVMTAEGILEEIKARKAWHEWRAASEAFEHHKLECPECHHTWAPDRAHPGPAPRECVTSLDVLDQENGRIVAWASAPSPVPEVPAPKMGIQEIAWQRQALAKVAHKAALSERLGAIVVGEDRLADLKLRRTYEEAFRRASYEHGLWDAWVEKKRVLTARLDEISDVDQSLSDLRQVAQESLLYEQVAAAHASAKDVYDRNVAKALEVDFLAVQYGNAKKALMTLKALVKSHLVPSLSRVASILLSQMTNGRFTTIVVDEDFNITVDGQDLDELSGSEKSVANLAVRIGLGQVLTNRVFPVFMGDELDAAMDDERAGFTAECLRNLTSRVAQVILVTHKRPEADHYIELGDVA
jgi:exonuclease SbcC